MTDWAILLARRLKTCDVATYLATRMVYLWPSVKTYGYYKSRPAEWPVYVHGLWHSADQYHFCTELPFKPLILARDPINLNFTINVADFCNVMSFIFGLNMVILICCGRKSSFNTCSINFSKIYLQSQYTFRKHTLTNMAKVLLWEKNHYFFSDFKQLWHLGYFLF